MRESLLMVIFCSLIALGCLTIAISLLIGGAVVTQGIDSLFVILVCLLMALVFSFVPVQAYRQGLFRGLLRIKRPGTATEPQRAAQAEPSETRERGTDG